MGKYFLETIEKTRYHRIKLLRNMPTISPRLACASAVFKKANLKLVRDLIDGGNRPFFGNAIQKDIDAYAPKYMLSGSEIAFFDRRGLVVIKEIQRLLRNASRSLVLL